MIPTRLAFVLAAGLAVSCNASAHYEFQNDSWCEHGMVLHTGGFAFTRDDLVAEFNRRQLAAIATCVQEAYRPTPASGGVGTCGVFDPPYEVAFSMARAACGAPSATPTPNDVVVAIVEEPSSFNDANHHQTFDFDAGLSGMCGYCVEGAAPPPTAPPIRHN